MLACLAPRPDHSVWDTVRTAGHRPHWMVMMAQTAGWLYPFYALSYYHWWVGMRRAGSWLAHVPCGLLAYALLMPNRTKFAEIFS